MKSFTIHNVDDQLVALLKSKAEEQGTSMNRTIKRLIEQALGLKPRPQGDNRREFEAFLGTWSDGEVSRFSAATADFERIDDEDWR